MAIPPLPLGPAVSAPPTVGVPPQVDYRKAPSAGSVDAPFHEDRDHPNPPESYTSPWTDDTFKWYDTPSDARDTSILHNPAEMQHVPTAAHQGR